MIKFLKLHSVRHLLNAKAAEIGNSRLQVLASHRPKVLPAMAQERQKRTERLQLMLSDEELEAIDRWRYENMIPTRAAAIRELLRRGLLSKELAGPEANRETGDYSVIPDNASPDD